MKVVLVSSFLNHHQKPLCEAFLQYCDEFWFVAIENTPNVGYQKASQEQYVLSYFDDKQKEFIKEQILEADLVIFGSCPTELISYRMKENKLSFIYAERFFKKGTWRRFIPSTRNTIQQKIVKYKDKNLYVLAASAFLSYDLSLLKYPSEKCFQWGYFPIVKNYNINELITGKQKNSILWCGRLISLKHADHAILVAEKLKKNGYNFQLNMIGDGPMKDKLKSLIAKKGLDDCVHLLGAKSTEEVRLYMEQSKIFLFTSNRMEGWGAVANEAMNSGCALVASNAIGSIPFLIKDGINGVVYKSGSLQDLYIKIVYLLENPDKVNEFSKRAYETVSSKWVASEAVARLLCLAQEAQKGIVSPTTFIDGPCSNAKIIKDNWYKRKKNK